MQEENSLLKIQSVLRTQFQPQTILCQRFDVPRLTPYTACIPDWVAALHHVYRGRRGKHWCQRAPNHRVLGTAQPHVCPPVLSNSQPTCTLVWKHEQHDEQTLVSLVATWALLQDENYLSNLSQLEHESEQMGGGGVQLDFGGLNKHSSGVASLRMCRYICPINWQH